MTTTNFNRGDTVSITAGIRSRELCQAPINASVILSLAGVVGERLSFSNLQMKMQRRLQPDSNARLEATYRHSLICRRARNDHGYCSQPALPGCQSKTSPNLKLCLVKNSSPRNIHTMILLYNARRQGESLSITNVKHN